MGKFDGMLICTDLDGTLLNTIDDLAASVNHVLGLHGYPLHEVEKYPSFVGNGIEKLLDKSDSILDKHSIRVYKKKEDVSNFIKLLLDKGYNVFEYKLETLTLEEAFLKKAGGNKID
jgi:phosphoglycolate phosphatase-like HAD superfamily hydrolase